MAYRFRCNTCDRVFTSNSRSAVCDRHTYRSHSASFMGEVVETTVDVALAYTGVTAAIEVAGAAGDLLGSIFNWD
ncbi:hypothetical protein phiPsa267_160 [Pseudomonas phage phiPsa267]|uniref:C2H2-type domain-containing protein n=2 Tax=Otagovirus TaxID=2560197 RepID=A0A7G9V129_9CAUD|nr:hypothetical protein QGX19_gp070 [Pseudomonas phage phiPsa267]YP_010767944.1 hypothetical protein QGX20_gp064 [Pseudomonas phage phiPsa300]QNN99984.1 hypothetical protein phiPsa267_160 [Pseudomonas phage phiPsa267]QNO00158.1 hypothetical protein phiPsa300_158 [Pseudomonas phage phiPsa300]